MRGVWIVEIVRFVRIWAKNLRRGFLMRFLMLVLLAVVVGCGGDDGVSPGDARGELDKRDIEYTDAAFLRAARSGDLEVVRLFVEAGMSVDARDNAGRTALHSAAREGHLEVVDFLVGAGLAVDTRAEYGVTALHLAAFRGHLAVVRVLVDAGASLTATNNKGRTPREAARRKGHTAIVAYFDSL